MQMHQDETQNGMPESVLGEQDVRFHNIKNDPFEVYGLYRYREEPEYKRMPDEVANGTDICPNAKARYRDTAGGRIRFSSDSIYVAVHVKFSEIKAWSQMPLLNAAGCDLYIDDPETGTSRYVRPLAPGFDVIKTKEYSAIYKFKTRKLRYFTIHMPAYSSVTHFEVGLQADATLGEGMKYLDILPMVYYGSSITQGAAAGRPGMSFENIVSRRLRIDYINLGFAGGAKGEESLARYMATLPMSMFISDYDHNSAHDRELRATHQRLYDIIREKNPDIPYLILSRPDMDGDDYELNEKRRDVVIDTYRYARAKGDQNVYFIDGAEIFRGEHEFDCTADSVHPNDLGFSLMADAIIAAIKRMRIKKYV